MNIMILDYKMSNMFSIQNIFAALGVTVNISSVASDIERADALVIPGVGAFGEAMASLQQLNLIEPIKQFIDRGKPFFGICLGLQLLFTQSYEFGVHRGLDIIPGEVVKFQAEAQPLRVPCIGWNKISPYASWNHSPLETLQENTFVYFVHSFYVKPQHKDIVLATTQYVDINYCSVIQKKNIFATQFHPEKSGKIGLAILNRWINLL